MYRRILVPLDGSDSARLGLREAITLAKSQREKATLGLLHVTSEFPVMLEISATGNFERVKRSFGPHAEGMLDEAKALAASLEVPAETQVRDLKTGRVADVIVEDARESGCDLIVIGTHGRRGTSRVLLGSDAENVLRKSPVPVLLVRERTART